MKSQQLVESTLLNQNSVEETENGIAGHQQMDYDVATNSSALDNREDETYFHSYEDLEVHRIMLKDVPRTEAYRQAILGNKEFFTGKTVMDVGAGTGILSLFCAQAGAAKVYAVEAADGLVNLIREVVAKNGFSHVIEVIHGKAEEVELPSGGPQQVDVIVSEWMGFYLLHESMLDSVIKAREKHLKPDGLMLPSRAALYSAGCSLNAYHAEHVDPWKEMYGLDLSPVGQALMDSKRIKPEIAVISADDVITEPILVADFDLNWLSVEEIQRVSLRCFTSVKTTIEEPVPFRGVCLWFDCSFDAPGCDTPSVRLSTSPQSPPTHWQQTVILLPGSITVEEGDVIGWELSLISRRNIGQQQQPEHLQKQRGYIIELNLLDAEADEHPVPCGCGQARCAIIAAFMAKEEVEPEADHQ